MPGFAVMGAGVGDYGTHWSNKPDTTPREITGTFQRAVDPTWGGQTWIYVRASATIRQFGICTFAAVYDSATRQFITEATEVANTANLGRALGIAQFNMTVGQYGWLIVSGVTPVNCSANLAAGAIPGITAAGQAGANTAGKEILSANTSLPATQTVVKANSNAASGSLTLNVNDSEGWFPGLYLGGTGIAAGTTIVEIDPSGRRVTLSAATTAVVNGNVTGTYNNGTIHYNVLHVMFPSAQGAIT